MFPVMRAEVNRRHGGVEERQGAGAHLRRCPRETEDRAVMDRVGFDVQELRTRVRDGARAGVEHLLAASFADVGNAFDEGHVGLSSITADGGFEGGLVLLIAGRYNPGRITMTDSKRLPTSAADAESTGRDSRVDALLVEGLERYFEGEFDEAIHLWTRVLFLDRSHASARAYIDRARGALAERQRHAEESLQQVATLLVQGRAAEARQLLQQTALVLGEDERTATLRVRLERLDRASAGAPRIRAAMEPAAAPWGQWFSDRLTLRVWLVAAVLVVAAVGLTSRGVQERLGVGRVPASPVPASTPSPVPVLTSADVALVRARTLFARGRLAEALRALDRVGPEQDARADADTLRVDIQRLLLAAAGEGRVSADGRQGPR